MRKLVIAHMVTTCNTCQKELAVGDSINPHWDEPKPAHDADARLLEHNILTGHMTARVVPVLQIIEVNEVE